MWMVLITVSYTVSLTSIRKSSDTHLLDRIPCIYLSIPLYNYKGFDFTCVKYINSLFLVGKSSPRFSLQRNTENSIWHLGYTWNIVVWYLRFSSDLNIWITGNSLSCVQIWKMFHMWKIENSYFIWEHFSPDSQNSKSQNSKSHIRIPSKHSWWKYREFQSPSMTICGKILYCL